MLRYELSKIQSSFNAVSSVKWLSAPSEISTEPEFESELRASRPSSMLVEIDGTKLSYTFAMSLMKSIPEKTSEIGTKQG